MPQTSPARRVLGNCQNIRDGLGKRIAQDFKIRRKAKGPRRSVAQNRPQIPSIAALGTDEFPFAEFLAVDSPPTDSRPGNSPPFSEISRIRKRVCSAPSRRCPVLARVWAGAGNSLTGNSPRGISSALVNFSLRRLVFFFSPDGYPSV